MQFKQLISPSCYISNLPSFFLCRDTFGKRVFSIWATKTTCRILSTLKFYVFNLSYLCMLSHFYGCWYRSSLFWLQDEERSTLLKRSNTDSEEATLCNDQQKCTGSLKKTASKVSRNSHNQLPQIHEDYYGPRRHRSRHH